MPPPPARAAGCIRRRLEQEAGRAAGLFGEDAVGRIRRAARGRPRAVSSMCLAAMIAAAGAGKRLVGRSAARAAVAGVIATG